MLEDQYLRSRPDTSAFIYIHIYILFSQNIYISFLLPKLSFSTHVILPILKIDSIEIITHLLRRSHQLQKTTESQQFLIVRSIVSTTTAASTTATAPLLPLLAIVRRALQTVPQIQCEVPAQIVEVDRVGLVPIAGELGPYYLKRFDVVRELLSGPVGAHYLEHARFVEDEAEFVSGVGEHSQFC